MWAEIVLHQFRGCVCNERSTFTFFIVLQDSADKTRLFLQQKKEKKCELTLFFLPGVALKWHSETVKKILHVRSWNSPRFLTETTGLKYVLQFLNILANQQRFHFSTIQFLPRKLLIICKLPLSLIQINLKSFKYVLYIGNSNIQFLFPVLN